ncbi:MAG: caspase family protein [Acidobacteria bacterium]|nr:caspase family protein [Acidobacteriota bacterium]
MNTSHRSNSYINRLLIAAIVALCGLPQSSAQPRAERGVALDNSQTSPGRYHALVIGNNAYKSIRPLKTAEEDAREIERVLRGRYGFQTKLLLNATRQQIISALNDYRRVLVADSSLLIYYAGHGYNDEEADKAYWLPVDASPNDSSNWVSADDITTNIKTIPARHVLIVSDSCYSGTLDRGIGQQPLDTTLARQRYLQKMLLSRSRTLMASGGNEPVADGGGGKHSVFAKALLRGLSTIDKELFTADELFHTFVRESVAGGANQTPVYYALRNSGHDSGDFVFARTGVIPVSPSATGGTVDTPDLHNKAATSAGVTQGNSRGGMSLAGTVWIGSSPEAGQYRIEFLKAGQLNYVIDVRQNGVTSPKTVRGTWMQSGESIRIVIGNHYSVWQGVIEGNTMRGEGSNQEGAKWAWSLMKKD